MERLYHFFTTHAEYLGLTPEEIASGVATTDGLTTTITIPDGTDPGTLINDTDRVTGCFERACGQRSVHRVAGNRRGPFQPRLRLTPLAENPI